MSRCKHHGETVTHVCAHQSGGPYTVICNADEADRMLCFVPAEAPALPPQPPPTEGHGDVTEDVLRDVGRIVGHERPEPASCYLDALGLYWRLCHHAGLDPLAVLRQRREAGVAEYGACLRYDDGRGIGDAVEEAADLCCYLRREMGAEP